ncbi:MAG: hypothetical protein U0441_31350 [Polyangiaceae bacterium]
MRLGPVLAIAGAASCTEIDTARQAGPIATLGDDLYGVLCDRLGASSLAEDTSGESYQGLCHPSSAGKYEDDVDVRLLPPVSGDKATKARERSIAKMRAMARWRADLVRAFNATFPDVEIDDVTTDTEGDKVRLHEGLMKLGQALTPLYETNPFEEGKDPLLPSTTRALKKVLDAIANNDEAKAALSRIWARRAYRPFTSELGAVQAALGYPSLRAFTKASLNVLGPKGAAAAQLQQLFAVGKHELANATVTDSALPPLHLDDPAANQLNRPRTALEFSAGLMLAEDKDYAGDLSSEWYIAARDRRGLVIPFGNVPGDPATVSSPFADTNKDGFADVDGFGRFVDGSGTPLTLDRAFAYPGVTAGPVDGQGRPQTPIYQYINTARTPLAAITRSLKTLADPQNGALLDALAGARVLFGPREQARYDYTKDSANAILGPGQECPTVPADACVDYERFKGEESPLVDLLYASGPLLADPDSDALLAGLSDLVENHSEDVARLLGAALKIRQIALDHDKLAEQGKEPVAGMDYKVPIWDEIAEILWHISEEPNLIQKLVKGFSDPVLTSPQGSSPDMGHTLATFILNKDSFNYDTNNINGPSVNLTDNAAGGSIADPKHLIDQTKPKTGDNVSLFERTLSLIHLVNRVKMCNKQDAHVFADVFGGWVIPGGYDECNLVKFENLGGFYVDAILPDGHKKRSRLEIQNGTLQDLLNVVGIFQSPDDLFQNSSGITGMTMTPTLPALNRLVFFGAESDLYNMPDIDPNINGKNDYPNQFISNMLNPAPTVLCPKKPNGVNECTNADTTLRVMMPKTIFAWERLGFYSYLRPVVQPFAEVSCNSDASFCPNNNPVDYYRGEEYFLDLIDALYKHWSKDGGNTYEPMLADSFVTDMLPALQKFSDIATKISKVTVSRGPNKGQVLTGGDVLAKTARILFSRDYAAGIGLTDRKGNKAGKWTDGTPQDQVTVYSLFADALHGMDVRFDTACDLLTGSEKDACVTDTQDRKAKWKSARSRLVDEFLAVDGTGPGATWHNKATPKVLATTLTLLRQQVNAHCPNRENGGGCDWARKEMPDKLARTLSGPLFAALMDLLEPLRVDDAARLETEKLLVYLMDAAGQPEKARAMLATLVDVVQVLQDDADVAPILRAAAPGLNPANDPDGAGVGDTAVKMLLAVTDDKYDPYHVMDYVLPAAVSPMKDASGAPVDRAPIEIFIDAITDIHRIDAAADAEDDRPLDTGDYGTIFDNVQQFLSSPTRGLEQFYFIVQHRPKPE